MKKSKKIFKHKKVLNGIGVNQWIKLNYIKLKKKLEKTDYSNVNK